MMILDCKGGGELKNLEKSDYVIHERSLRFIKQVFTALLSFGRSLTKKYVSRNY